MLAELAEEIDQYHNEVARMVKSLGVNQHTPYCKFEGVARKIFRDAIDWRKIVTFFIFGNETVLSAIKKGDEDVKHSGNILIVLLVHF